VRCQILGSCPAPIVRSRARGGIGSAWLAIDANSGLLQLVIRRGTNLRGYELDGHRIPKLRRLISRTYCGIFYRL
jgi:hypothetical protein